MKHLERSTALVTAACLLGWTCAEAVAQCEPHWLPGASLPGPDRWVSSTTNWDPDGPGPEPELLMIAGTFSTLGTQTLRGLAGWDGQIWREIGVNEEGDIYTIRALAVYQ